MQIHKHCKSTEGERRDREREKGALTGQKKDIALDFSRSDLFFAVAVFIHNDCCEFSGSGDGEKREQRHYTNVYATHRDAQKRGGGGWRAMEVSQRKVLGRHFPIVSHSLSVPLSLSLSFHCSQPFCSLDSLESLRKEREEECERGRDGGEGPSADVPGFGFASGYAERVAACHLIRNGDAPL
jgi:hypothetical protein